MVAIKLNKVWVGKQETKYGEKDKCAIKFDQFGDKWISTFKVTDNMRTWKEGDTVNVTLTKKVTPTGEFINFEEELTFDGLGTKPVAQVQSSPKEEEIDITKDFIF